jgi:hypothetical protein
MPVCEQEYEDGVLQQTRVNFLGARGIEAVVTVDHFRQFLNGLQLTTGKGVVASALGIGIGGAGTLYERGGCRPLFRCAWRVIGG